MGILGEREQSCMIVGIVSRNEVIIISTRLLLKKSEGVDALD